MLQGSMVALATPMLASGEIDWPAIDKLVDMHVDQGTSAIIPTGTTGESATLNVTEHAGVISRVVAHANGRLSVIAGTGANATEEAITLTKMAADAGVDACLLVTPYYNKPTQEGLYRHYMAIAEAVDIPQLLYNVPGRTACDLLPETVHRLIGHPRIIGIKEASSDVGRVAPILQAKRDAEFVVLSGEDAQNHALMQAGASGCISVTANVAPKLMAEFCKAALTGDSDRAGSLHEELMPLHEVLFVESNPIPVKWAMQRLGLMKENGIRLPLTPLSKAACDSVEKVLRASGLLATT